MEEMQQITLEQWLAWKEDIREKLRETAGNFVHIGFRLKQIRESGMLDGAADIFEFALKEYGLSKSSTSRFIAINEKFSEGGNSLELKEEYRAIGSSKLAEMLTLTDAECSLITERTTVKEIRELKSFSRQQASEVEQEEESRREGSAFPSAAGTLSPLQKCLADYFRDKKEVLNAVIKAVQDVDYKAAAELMNPSGYGTHKKGLCFMFMYDFNTGVKVKYLTVPEPETLEWSRVLLEAYAIYADLIEAGEADVHKAYYRGTVKQEPESKPESKTTKTEKAAENQSAEGSDEVSVATSQQKPDPGFTESIEEPAEEAADETGEQEPDNGPEIKVSEVEETAENQSAADNSVATSQQEEDADTEDDEDETWDDEPEDKEKWVNGPAAAKEWDKILRGEMLLTDFVAEYTETDAAEGEISVRALKDAYKQAIDLAAAFESLIILYAKEDWEDE
ncbi:MAG: hypothetical protein NC517_09920 [Firmicutes bacterium]|nr:hypothetical protein [Bacillota bacterium]